MRARSAGVLALLATSLAVPLPCRVWTAAPGAAGKEATPADRYGDPLPQGALRRLGTIRFNHPLTWCIAFSGDGRFLASGGGDKRIRLHDLDTGKQRAVLRGHTDVVRCLALSADGGWLASGGQDKEVRLWRTDTGKEERRFLGHDGAIEHLALSGDGALLAAACQAGRVRLWNTKTGKPILLPAFQKRRRLDALALSCDGKMLASANHLESEIHLVAIGGKESRALVGHKGRVFTLRFAADGKTLFSGGADKTIRAWKTATGKERGRYGGETSSVRCLALARDGKTLAYATEPDGLVHIWNVAANTPAVAPWAAHPWCVLSIDFSPDGKTIIIAHDTIALHETATGKRLHQSPESMSPIRQVTHSRDGRRLAVRRQDGSIELHDTANWKKSILKSTIGRFTAMTFSPDGRWLTTAEDGFDKGVLCHHDPRSGNRKTELFHERGWIERLVYLPNGRTLACLHGPGRSVLLVDSTTGRLLPKDLAWGWREKSGFAEEEPFALTPDGRTSARPGGNAARWEMVLWEIATGKERLHLPLSDGPLSRVAFSAAGRWLASVGAGETIWLWDAFSGKELAQFRGHRGSVSCLSFAPDGRSLASGGMDGTVLIWELSGLSNAKKPAEKLAAEALARCWDELAGADAPGAYRALGRLVQHPGQAEELLKAKLAKHPAMSGRKLAQLIIDLDDDRFATRTAASEQLAALGRVAEDSLKETLAAKPSLEVRMRIERLLKKLEGQGDDPERRRLLRVIEVLERLGTPSALQLLATLAQEAESTLAREAKAALGRLGNRP
jgi:WD40 repeat protein